MTGSSGIVKVGLTGGIASGKSTVAGWFRELGAYVQDGDAVAHQVMEPGGAAYDDVVGRFGDGILDRDRSINRVLLGELVFQDSAAREELNRLVHPKVREASADMLSAYLADGGSAPMMIFEAALLVETGMYREYDSLVVVSCSREEQLERLLSRGFLTVDGARARIEAQLPLSRKLAVADYVIDTSTSPEQSRIQTEKVFRKLAVRPA
ncbi:MAG: dephospho-CoA kinase [Acidobacteria bacterium]|uniref:Dephospho-CoA kinase n=1 Tax=Candidatus Polarisedimenticola svalbardensis TaxID=2886004 RepID=A0A8J6XXJ5_9BACT|nr:dephospho-CoA kinase [Candidatus Polarisedimenticola svalbardensis]